jgi:hypothetical protein
MTCKVEVRSSTNSFSASAPRDQSLGPLHKLCVFLFAGFFQGVVFNIHPVEICRKEQCGKENECEAAGQGKRKTDDPRYGSKVVRESDPPDLPHAPPEEEREKQRRRNPKRLGHGKYFVSWEMWIYEKSSRQKRRSALHAISWYMATLLACGIMEAVMRFRQRIPMTRTIAARARTMPPHNRDTILATTSSAHQ